MPRQHGKLERAGVQRSTHKRDTSSFSTADSYVLFCKCVCVFVCVSLSVGVHAYLFRKIDSDFSLSSHRGPGEKAVGGGAHSHFTLAKLEVLAPMNSTLSDTG